MRKSTYILRKRESGIGVSAANPAFRRNNGLGAGGRVPWFVQVILFGQVFIFLFFEQVEGTCRACIAQGAYCSDFRVTVATVDVSYTDLSEILGCSVAGHTLSLIMLLNDGKTGFRRVAATCQPLTSRKDQIFEKRSRA